MIDHVADLFSNFAGMVHDNERRWRVFRSRVEQIVATLTPATVVASEHSVQQAVERR